MQYLPVENMDALDKRIRSAFKRGKSIDEAFAKAAEFARLRKELMAQVRRRRKDPRTRRASGGVRPSAEIDFGAIEE
jgi:hypothetical protein